MGWDMGSDEGGCDGASCFQLRLGSARALHADACVWCGGEGAVPDGCVCVWRGGCIRSTVQYPTA